MPFHKDDDNDWTELHDDCEIPSFSVASSERRMLLGAMMFGVEFVVALIQKEQSRNFGFFCI